MFQFRVNGVPLVLFPGTEAPTEFQHPITMEELGNAFTMPLEVPVRGNEEVLGNVHELALADRTIRIDGVEFWRGGEFAHRGVFYVQGSTPGPDGTVSLSFSVDGFISAMAGKELRDVDYGPDILLPATGELIGDATYRNTQAWPDARYCYPMIYNPEAYAGANEDWYKDPPEYDIDKDYDVTDPPTLVTFETGTFVRRKRVFKCIGTAPAGESPDVAPWDWELYPQALINPWNPLGGAWLQNVDVNNCAMCPQFYLKDILTRAMADQGLTAQGTFMDDVDTHRIVLHNNHLLDEPDNSDHLLASYTSDETFPAGTAYYDRTFSPDDDSTAPNEDVSSIYSAGIITPTASGPHTIRIHVKVSFTTAARVWVVLVNSSASIILQAYSGSDSFDNRENWEFTYTNTATLTAGEDYHVLVVPALYVYPLGMIAADYIGSTNLETSFIEVTRGTGELTNVYARRIHPADHVPEITLEHLLLDLRDLFHLRITPLTDEGIVRFDYQEDVLDRTLKKDITPLLRSRVRFDHTARTNGVRLKMATGRAESLPDLGEYQDIGATVISEEFELGPPWASDQKVYVRSTGEQLVARLYDTNQYAWFPAGWLNPDAEVGDMNEAREVAPELGIPSMEVRPTHYGGPCLMPVISEKCSSKMYGLGNNAPQLLMYYYHGMQQNFSGEYYPLASPFRYDQLGTEVGQVSLNYDPDDAKSLYTLRWKRWLDLLVNAEVIEAEVDITTLITAQGVPLERFMAHNQVVLFDLMPVNDTEDVRALVSTVRMLKLPSA